VVEIPGEEEVPSPSAGREVWRASEGKIVTGRKQDNTLREREKIVGALRRIGVHSGISKIDNTPYSQLEADIETREGMVRFKSGITDKLGKLQPSTAALSFAEGLLDLAANELMVVTANSSTKENRFGSHNTYINLHHLDATVRPLKTWPTKRRPIDKSLTMEEQWSNLEAELQAHPSWAERPKDDTEEDEGEELSHLGELCREVAAKGWPTPEQAPQEWLPMVAKFFKHADKVRASLTDYSDDEWGRVRQAMQAVPKMPDALIPARDRLAKGGGAPAQAEEEVDAFK
jgi:hypothetical protein